MGEFLLFAGIVLLFLKGKGGEPPDEPVILTNPPKWPEEPPPDPGQPPTPKGPRGFVPDGPVEPPVEPSPDPELPPISDWEDPYPTPDQFYQVMAGDYPLKVAQKALTSAGYLAARDVGGLPDDQALAFASQVGNSEARQRAYVDLYQCSGWNDAAYGTYGAGEDQRYSSHNRSIRFIKHHANNRARLSNGQAPIRNQALGSISDVRKGNRYGVDPTLRQAFPFLWLPGVDLQTLWETGGAVVKYGERDDGTSSAMPPEGFVALGIEDASDVPIDNFGCGAGFWDLTEGS